MNTPIRRQLIVLTLGCAALCGTAALAQTQPPHGSPPPRRFEIGATGLHFDLSDRWVFQSQSEVAGSLERLDVPERARQLGIRDLHRLPTRSAFVKGDPAASRGLLPTITVVLQPWRAGARLQPEALCRQVVQQLEQAFGPVESLSMGREARLGSVDSHVCDVRYQLAVRGGAPEPVRARAFMKVLGAQLVQFTATAPEARLTELDEVLASVSRPM